jgi:hypothetical protein
MIARIIGLIHWLRLHPISMATIVYGLGVGVWFLVTPADALNNRQGLLIGAGIISPASKAGAAPALRFTAPSLSDTYDPDFPRRGLGETAAQIRMTGGGVLSNFWLKILTTNVPASGSLVATVRINGADTALTCQVFGTAQCNSGPATVNVPNGARLSVAFASDFPDSGAMAFTYSMLLD